MCDTMIEKLGDYYLFRCSECNKPVQTKRATRRTCGGECALRRKRRMEVAWQRSAEQRAKQSARFRAWYEKNREHVLAKVAARKVDSL